MRLYEYTAVKHIYLTDWLTAINKLASEGWYVTTAFVEGDHYVALMEKGA